MSHSHPALMSPVGLGINTASFSQRPSTPLGGGNGDALTPNTGNAAQSIPDGDDVRVFMYQLKQKYDAIADYVLTIRPQREMYISECSPNLATLESVYATASPSQQAGIMFMATNIKTSKAQMEEETVRLDVQAEQEKQWIADQFRELFRVTPDPFKTLAKEISWPTIQVCLDVDADEDVIRMLRQRDGVGLPSYLSNHNDLMQELKSYVRDLMKNKTGAGDSHGGSAGRSKGDSIVKSEKTRRYRKILPFDPKMITTAETARVWLSKYQWYSKYDGISETQIMVDLPMYLDNGAFTWFTNLPKPTQKSWDLFSTAFLRHYAAGLSSTEAALQELKKFQKGTLSMHDFGSKLTSLFNDANVFALNLQLDYLKSKVSTKLCEALILKDPQTLDDALSVCARMEAHMLTNSTANVLPMGSTTPTFPEGVQNAQRQFNNGSFKEKRTCYHCKKPGHIKKNCRALKNRKNHGRQNVQTDEVPSIFARFAQQNVAVRKIRKENNDTNRLRFYIEATTTDGHLLPPILVDTGSTISTMNAAVVKEFGLTVSKCSMIEIEYGNKTTQTTDCMAGLIFKTEDMQDDQAVDIFVVEQQNEPIILGMDWMADQPGLCLMPYDKKMYQVNSSVINPVDSDHIIHELLSQFPEITAVEKQQPITNAPYKHRIETGDVAPVVSRDYRRPPAENQAIQEMVQDMLMKGVIQASDSPWCSPVVLVSKPDGSKRFCVDYRNLNKVTIPDKYPIPRISELLDQLKGNRYFTTIDLKSGYWHIPVADEHRAKTAFLANGSLYEFRVLPFGVTNGPPTFQRFMKGVLSGLKNILVYLDDIICFSSTLDEHIKSLKLVLGRLQQYNLKISPSKCQWIQGEVKFLGFLVGVNGIRANPEKTAAIRDWPLPQTVRALQRFLGICIFYHRFIKNLAMIAAPLYGLLKKDVEFVWTQERLTAFEKLKLTVCDLTSLSYPDPQAPYDLHTDASTIGIGAVLVQRGRPIAFASRTLTPAEQNYSTTEQECLAVVWSLEYFYCYVYGSTLTLYTDHMALKAILSTKMPRGRLSRWILTIQSFRFTIVHRKGIHNLDADALSRQHQQNTQADITTVDASLLIKLQQADAVISALRRGEDKTLSWKNGIAFANNVPVIPRSLVKSVLKLSHDNVATGGHFGFEKTLNKTKKVGWWPSMIDDIKEWIRTCERCQIYKIDTKNTTPPLKSITPGYVGEIWAADIAVLPTSKNGNSYILVFMEYLTKWAVTAALPSFDSNHVAQVLLFEIVLKFGIIRRLITDNASNFISDAMNLVCTRLDIKRSLTSVEHPNTDGLVERYNRTLKEGLAIYVDQDPLTWDTYLPFVTFAYNTAKHASTGYSPFKLLYGRDPDIPLSQDIRNIQPRTYESEQWLAYLNEHLPALHSDAIENIKKAQSKQKKYYDPAGPVNYVYSVGDLVKRRNLEKLTFPKQRWSGPWIIIAKNNEDGTSWVIQRKDTSGPMGRTTANVKHLRPWKSRENIEEDS